MSQRYLTQLLLLVAIAVLPATAGAQVQTFDVIWSTPINLSNTPESSSRPAIVADQYGYVHVLWSEDVGGEDTPNDQIANPGNALVYTRWDGTKWTPPIDVLSVYDDSLAMYPAADVGPDGRIHVVWTGLSKIYYASAPVSQAHLASAWSAPLTVSYDGARSQFEVDVRAGPDGIVNIIYATRSEDIGVHFIQSLDGGFTWSEPVTISTPLDNLEKGFSSLRIVYDSVGRLHATWQSFQDQGYGQAVYYARSLDKGRTWEDPIQFRYRGPDDVFVEWPYLTASGDGDLQLVYVDGISSGRAYRTSKDGGETWSEASQILQEMEGVNGYVIPVIDGSGATHLIANMRTKGVFAVGVYYARKETDRWSLAVPIDNTSPAAPTAHYTAAAVRLGNEIHVVYNQLRGGEIWYVRGDIIGVPPTQAESLPESAEMVTVRPTPSPLAAGQSLPDAIGLSESETQPSSLARPPLTDTEASSGNSAFLALVLSTLLALILVTGVAVWTLLHRR